MERFGFGVQLVEAETGRVLWMQAGHFRAETSGHYGTAEAAMVDTIRAALNEVNKGIVRATIRSVTAGVVPKAGSAPPRKPETQPAEKPPKKDDEADDEFNSWASE